MAKRNKYNLGNKHLVTCNMGELIPVQCIEVLPNDSMKLGTTALIRTTPLQAPIMHPVQVRFQKYFVPTRLIFDEWEDFITGGPDNDNTDVVPKMAVPAAGTTQLSLLDYLGIPPTSDAAGVQVSELPVRAFNYLYNEEFRDPDIITTARLEDDITIPKVKWPADYFTTAKPWPYKGDEITIPLQSSAPVASDAASSADMSYYDTVSARYETMTIPATNLRSSGAAGTEANRLYADLSTTTGISVEDLKEIFALNNMARARAMFGSKYSEYLRYLGATPQDSRLQRPEFLGGGKQGITFSEVLQTSPDATTSTEVGEMKGHGINSMRTRSNIKHFQEHGYLFTLMSVVPQAIYSQGIHRSWLRTNKEDYYQPELAHIGQQEIYNNEIYGDSVSGTDTFGWTNKYGEYTFEPNIISSEFRDILDHWHMARMPSSPPALNQTFIECDPTKRVFSEQTQHCIWALVKNTCIARRMVKKPNRRFLESF